MAHVIDADVQPSIGYKMVVLPNGQNGIATLSIPKTSTVLRTSYQVTYKRMPAADPAYLLRTNKVIVCKITPLGVPDKIMQQAQSMRSQKLNYNLGKLTERELGHPNKEDGQGIHFFADIKHAMMWTSLLRR